MAEYLKASGEDRPDMTVEVWLDGKKHKEVQIDAENLFYFDNQLRAASATRSRPASTRSRSSGRAPARSTSTLT